MCLSPGTLRGFFEIGIVISDLKNHPSKLHKFLPTFEREFSETRLIVAVRNLRSTQCVSRVRNRISDLKNPG